MTRGETSTLAVFLIAVTVVSISLPIVTSSGPVVTKEDAFVFLQEKGYIPRGQTSTLDVNQFTTALVNFQKFYGLSQTGVLDNATIAVMNQPRCGLPDFYITTNDIDFSRYKRFVAYGGWNRNHITYGVGQYSNKTSHKYQDEAFRRAFQIYQDATVLSFERKRDKNVDILISFFASYRDHGDGKPFDGPGNVVAHAAFPFDPVLSGDIHFDDDENWSPLSAFNLVAVAAHEIGHSLGLAHSNVLGAIMYPVYFNGAFDFKLHPDDILGIESLYGNGMTTVPHTRTKAQLGANNPNVPNLCRESMDAVIATDEGELIILKGSYVWRATDKGIKTGYPRLISQRWSGLQNKLNTGTQLKNTFWNKETLGKLLFVKGKSVWRYNMKQELDKSFPQDINKMLDVVAYKLNNLVGMFEMRENGDIYLFGETEFYIYNWWRMVQGPYSIQEVFKGAPTNIAAVFQWTDNKIYFFSHTGLIFRFRSDNFQLDGVPTSWFNPAVGETDWLSCSTNLVSGEENSQVRRSASGWILATCYLFVIFTLKHLNSQ
ncbi:Matrix metalloproteinase-14 [Holothuria leucospilota]|uniref:Matrix metalloproteinase-14 n=1 Tax=Holothuria leucospilota TaxID=206669 RepID=A0A9Q1CDC8_HOLLE|nr:Matrix metalloproteinase-14 [Holothuria leucospilota]